MAYQTPLTIAEVVADIEARKYLLPSIQREFVWSQHQIEVLFDSLMKDYPIDSFLFLEVSADKVQDFRFYEFLRNYHQREQRHNPLANTSGSHGVTAIHYRTQKKAQCLLKTGSMLYTLILQNELCTWNGIIFRMLILAFLISRSFSKCVSL